MAKRVPTIAEVLHLAADKYLCSELRVCGHKSKFSCHAVFAAIEKVSKHLTPVETLALERRIFKGLSNLGLTRYKAHSSRQFIMFKAGAEQQSVRYAWLKLCAHIAEEQGV